MELYRRMERYWHTIRHLRPAQIASRVDLRTRAAVRNLSPGMARRRYADRAARAALTFAPDPWDLRGSASLAAPWIPPDALDALDRNAAHAGRGTFVFLNERRDLGHPVDWSAPGASQLWRYHLHYFDYLPDLLVAGAAPLMAALMSDWTARVPMAEPATRDAWHPYVVSIRVVNWMLCLATAPEELHPPEHVVESLRVQTLFVRHNLETDVGGNHLLKNLKALAIAGCFWRGEGARALQERFTAQLVQTLEEQLRTDGGHYEQSPMYHAQVLGDAVELSMVLRRTGRVNPRLEQLIERMEGFLARVCHPDGQLAQFGDTAAGMTPDPRALLAAARALRGRHPDRRLAPRHALLAPHLAHRDDRQGCASAPAQLNSGTAAEPKESPPKWDPRGSGFVTLATADGRGFLIADAGPVCPDDLPAHAHSDLFSFELSVDGTRMVVDSGVSEYAAGPWRDYYRSTRAHSTVVVDGVEQSECWGSFRVARRARVVDARFEAGMDTRGFRAAHTGFNRLPSPVTHRRRFLLVGDRFWLVVDDLLGQGVHQWMTFLHLHPEVDLAPTGGPGFIASRAAAALGVGWFGIGELRCVTGERNPLQGWYAPAFGQVLPSPTIIGSGSGPLPVRFGWVLIPTAAAEETFRVDDTAADRLIVEAGRKTYVVPMDAVERGSAPPVPAARRTETADQ